MPASQLELHVDQCLSRLVGYVETAVQSTPSLGLAMKATRLAALATASFNPPPTHSDGGPANGNMNGGEHAATGGNRPAAAGTTEPNWAAAATGGGHSYAGGGGGAGYGHHTAQAVAGGGGDGGWGAQLGAPSRLWPGRPGAADPRLGRGDGRRAAQRPAATGALLPRAGWRAHLQMAVFAQQLADATRCFFAGEMPAAGTVFGQELAGLELGSDCEQVLRCASG